MAQLTRRDEPGRRHHVMNRGVAKIRFIALIACGVRRGEMRVESLIVMDTHFHLLAYNPDGRIHYPLMRVLNAYARYFNRRYKRDGSPFRGRFRSVPVLSDRHWHCLIQYIDFNAVKAGLVGKPSLYPYGTARIYATRSHGPAWLEGTAVDARLRAACGSHFYSGDDYRCVFGIAPTAAEEEVVSRRVSRPAPDHDELQHLDTMPPMRIPAWMRRKARPADGT